jgi:hypothetical protein
MRLRDAFKAGRFYLAPYLYCGHGLTSPGKARERAAIKLGAKLIAARAMTNSVNGLETGGTKVGGSRARGFR